MSSVKFMRFQAFDVVPMELQIKAPCVVPQNDRYAGYRDYVVVRTRLRQRTYLSQC